MVKVSRSHFPNELTLLQLKIMKAIFEEARSFCNVLTDHRKFLPLRSAQFMRARPERWRSPSKFEGQ